MSGNAVETAASILTQKIDKEHQKCNHVKQQQNQKKQNHVPQSTKNTSYNRRQVLDEQCVCDKVKADIEAEGTSSVVKLITDDRSDGLLRKREAIAERNDTERILAKESVKVLTRNTILESYMK